MFMLPTHTAAKKASFSGVTGVAWGIPNRIIIFSPFFGGGGGGELTA